MKETFITKKFGTEAMDLLAIIDGVLRDYAMKAELREMAKKSKFK